MGLQHGKNSATTVKSSGTLNLEINYFRFYLALYKKSLVIKM
jgi:hypothetical protein